MDFTKTVAVVTGANRGLGRQFAEQLISRGAKVYATARRPETVDIEGAIPLRLDITDHASIEAAAEVAADATLLINNAGISSETSVLDADFDTIRLELETHYVGPLAAIRAFAPIIERNGGGAVLNVASVLSWLHAPGNGAYVVAKAAEWAMTNLVRQELAPKGITVTGLHVGYMDTDMAAHVPSGKADPAEVVRTTLDAVAKGEAEVIYDELSRKAKANLSAAL
ncbi:SDR family oxidoreductase [Kutzneria kofuensis]|uniref:NAD(P)-dependent dehydrogenase (Short-subunit alcohol dehydrogenase family) n=1 Tax=Kutzneria kofuensis TaxID=103725 RepID=A0A7W9KNN8_9PSEU|nr:SDR family oxidoreductase [Kutzneria kofuensis]MBB5895892.1 NAD(P)-dependent dehydrogenase (short-subunit alcohol dehydrogenase family) [Kutzneria kofuensis]